MLFSLLSYQIKRNPKGLHAIFCRNTTSQSIGDYLLATINVEQENQMGDRERFL